MQIEGNGLILVQMCFLKNFEQIRPGLPAIKVSPSRPHFHSSLHICTVHCSDDFNALYMAPSAFEPERLYAPLHKDPPSKTRSPPQPSSVCRCPSGTEGKAAMCDSCDRGTYSRRSEGNQSQSMWLPLVCKSCGDGTFHSFPTPCISNPQPSSRKLQPWTLNPEI